MRECLLGVTIWLVAVIPVLGAAVERVVLAENLANPTAVASHAAEDGGVRVLVAESGNGQLTEFNLLGESVFGREVIGRFASSEVVGLAVLGERRGLLGPDGMSLLTLQEEAADAKPPAGEAILGAPAISDRWLFAPGTAGLLRGQLVQGRVSRLRPLRAETPPPVAIAFSPEGYLVTMTGTQPGEHRLGFYDPNEPATPIADYELRGLSRPVALAYAAGDSRHAAIFALDASDEPAVAGLYRVEVALKDRRPRAVARLIASLADPSERPTGMTVLPGGGVVVITSDGERGSLVRLAIAR